MCGTVRARGRPNADMSMSSSDYQSVSVEVGECGYRQKSIGHACVIGLLSERRHRRIGIMPDCLVFIALYISYSDFNNAGE